MGRRMPDDDDDDNEVEFSNLPLRIRQLITHLWDSSFGSTSDPNDLRVQIGQPSLVDRIVSNDSEDQESLEAERREENQPVCETENSADNEQNFSISSPTPNVPEDPEDPETLELVRKRKEKGVASEDSETSTDRQLTVFEGNHTPAEIDAVPDSDYDSDRPLNDLLTEIRNTRRRQHAENVNKAAKNKNNSKRKPKVSKNQRCRLLSDLSTELIDEYLEIPLPDEFVDDSTQNSSSELNVEEANLGNNKNKKHEACTTEESPRIDEAGLSNYGVVNFNGCTEPCGSESVVGQVSMAKPSNQGHNTRSSRLSGSRIVLGRDKSGPKRLNLDNEINNPCEEEAVRSLLSLGQEMTQATQCRGLGD